MAKVCEEFFPMGSYHNQRSAGFYMNDNLKVNLDAIIKNVKHDFDFLIIISAGGGVRVGKSVLALQIAMYWTYQIWKKYKIKAPFNIKENVIYNGSDLIEQGNKLGSKYKHAAMVFDEAGADLEGVKVMQKTTQAVKDFLRECGQYNMLNILVLPEYFDLPKGIAMSRSDFLLDCFLSVDKNDEFERGHFNFYSRPNKKMLYLKGKKELNYKAHKEDFHGDWEDIYPIEIEVVDGKFKFVGTVEDFETKYRSAKQKALKARSSLSSLEQRRNGQYKATIMILYDQGLTHREIADLINQRTIFRISHVTVGRILRGESGYGNEEGID